MASLSPLLTITGQRLYRKVRVADVIDNLAGMR